MLLVTVMVVLPTTVETLTRGRSLGKLAMGIRIVRDDGGPVWLPAGARSARSSASSSCGSRSASWP